MPNGGQVIALAPRQATGTAPATNAELLAGLRAITQQPGRSTSRPPRALAYMALAAFGPMPIAVLAELLNLEISHMTRVVNHLVEQGLASEVQPGVYACACTPMHALEINNKQLASTDISTYTGGGLRQKTTSDARGSLTKLTWQVPAVVQASPHLGPAIDLCQRLADQLETSGRRLGVAGSATTKAWVLPMEALLRLDLAAEGGERPPAERVAATLDWLDRGADEVAEFWRVNVLSPAALRRHWGQMLTRYQQLRRRQLGGKRQGLAEATGADDVIAAALAERGLR